jgi:hypothetical protein
MFDGDESVIIVDNTLYKSYFILNPLKLTRDSSKSKAGQIYSTHLTGLKV